MAALTGTQTVLSHGMSLFSQPTFWGQLDADQRRSCLQTNHPIRIYGRQAWDVSGILQQRWNSMFPFIQSHLNSRAAKIFRAHQGRQIEYALSLYMTGTPVNFRPTVVASCMHLDIAERIIRVTFQKCEKSGFFNPRPGFAYLAVNYRIVCSMESLWEQHQSGIYYRQGRHSNGSASFHSLTFYRLTFTQEKEGSKYEVQISG
jgi:hypothetical protein